MAQDDGDSWSTPLTVKPIDLVQSVFQWTRNALAVVGLMAILSANDPALSTWMHNLQPNAIISTANAFQLNSETESQLTDSEKATISVFERTKPSIVNVTTYQALRSRMSTNIMEIPAGQGTGIIWDRLGHIVTNFHVIRDAQSAKIRLDDQNSYDAELIGFDADKDVAVLKINAKDAELVPISKGNSATLKVGQTVFALGNPFGLDHSMTAGIISGLGREMRSPTNRPISNVIQTDASINPGNSGGSLLDSTGRLIGMNTSIYSPSGASAGVGFAIPVDPLKLIVEELIDHGKIDRPVIGITYLESSQARSLGIDEGVLILEVPSGSAAAKMGLRGTSRGAFGSIDLGDIIVGIDNLSIKTESDLFKALEEKKVGDMVKIRIKRGDDLMTVTLKLSSSSGSSQ